MARMTGEEHWLADAVRNALQMSARLYRPQTGLFTHGWTAANPDAPEFYWARANGWAMMAQCELLDVLPPGHPGRDRILETLRGQIHGVALRQSSRGLWHQMLDRDDSFLETSASAMFVYGIAHAINRGWISPAIYGSIAQLGWIGVSTQIDAKGEVENTCVGTTFGADQAYYCNRPVSPYALHGYGPALLAGSEVIRLLGNPSIAIKYESRTYHYLPVPKR
jgi:rhamnogalacturonyl hydrolase YesR